MVIEIIDIKKFGKSNGIHGAEFGENFSMRDLNVYAIAHYKKNQHFLLVNLIFGEHKYLRWINNDSTIQIVDNSIPNDWITKEDYNYYDTIEQCTLKLKSITCPKWMLDDKSFINDTFINPSKANQKFISYYSKTN